MSQFDAYWRAQVDQRLNDGLLRQRPLLQSKQGVEVTLDGQPVLSFASNDYLGFAGDERLVKAAAIAAENYGVGGGASHLVVGHHLEHQCLEEELAAFTKREKALVFSSGYMANLAVVSTLVGAGDGVFQDKLNHASLIDGGLLSGARFQRYLHNDANSLQTHVERFSQRNAGLSPRKLVVTDGVFSMDGDLADLCGIAKVCDEQHSMLVVDDAHGLGVLGDQGRGTLDYLGVTSEQVPVLIGTFGKAFGTAGAFVAGSAALIDYLEQFARPYIYTTSMPPMLAAATRQSLALIRAADDRRERLQGNIDYFREGVRSLSLELMESNTAIQPILIGDSAVAMSVASMLRANGILVGAIRPPTVPNNTARLRITICSEHSLEMLDRLIDALSQAKFECGL